MEDGQEVGRFAPDREADDPTDLEFNGGTPHAESTDEEESSGDNSDSEETGGDAETDTVTTTPTSGRQLKVVRLPHPLSDFWPNGVMMTASQKLVIQMQLSTRNLRECQRSAPPQPALP